MEDRREQRESFTEEYAKFKEMKDAMRSKVDRAHQICKGWTYFHIFAYSLYNADREKFSTSMSQLRLSLLSELYHLFDSSKRNCVARRPSK